MSAYRQTFTVESDRGQRDALSVLGATTEYGGMNFNDPGTFQVRPGATVRWGAPNITVTVPQGVGAIVMEPDGPVWTRVHVSGDDTDKWEHQGVYQTDADIAVMLKRGARIEHQGVIL